MRACRSATHAASLLLGLAACTSAASDTTASVSTRDSSGVTIVEHGLVDLTSLPQWRLDSTAFVRIGVTDGDEGYQFNRIVYATLRADGSIAVIDRSMTLRVFGSTGTLRWTVGRSGEGPGEFRAPNRVEALATTGSTTDTLLVWDIAHGRFSFFVEPEGLVREASLPALARRAAWLGLVDDRGALFEQRAFERVTEGTRQAMAAPSTLLRADANFSTVTELGTHAQALEYQEGNDPNGGFSGAIFAAYVRYASNDDGYWKLDPDLTEVQRIGVNGQRRIVRWQAGARTVTSADVDSMIALWLADARTPAQREAITRYAATHPRAARFPVYDTLLVADDGALWLRDYVREHADDGVRRWSRMAPDGSAFTTRLEHDASLRVLRVRDNEVLAVERDELDVETLVRFRIVGGSIAR